MDLYDLTQSVEALVQEFFEQNGAKTVDASQLGLDRRAGYNLIVSEGDYPGSGFVASSGSNTRSLSYYGGFEYVDNEYVTVVGDYTIYSAEDERVQNCIDCFTGATDEEENAE